MVADFMSDHVSLCKITGSVEAVAQLTIKIQIDIDLVIFRTIKRAGGSLRKAARRLDRFGPGTMHFLTIRNSGLENNRC